MNRELRSKYAEYISEGIRYSHKETGLNWPEETVIITKSYGELAELDEIIGFKIFVADIPTSFEFFPALPAFPASLSDKIRLLKSFKDYQEMKDML